MFKFRAGGADFEARGLTWLLVAIKFSSREMAVKAALIP